MQQTISRADARAQGAITYFTGKPCLRDHVAARHVSNGSCLECLKARQASKQYKLSRAKYRAENKDKISARSKERYLVHSEKYKADAKRRYKEDKKKILSRNEKWHAKNRDYMRSYAREYMLRRKRADLEFRLKTVIRNILSRSLRAGRKARTDRSHIMLGYSAADLRSHIQSIMAPGMTWENYGQWHIDHIRPLSSFDLSKIEQIRAANSLHNLQPMWAKDNLKKGNKWTGQLSLI